MYKFANLIQLEILITLFCLSISAEKFPCFHTVIKHASGPISTRVLYMLYYKYAWKQVFPMWVGEFNFFTFLKCRNSGGKITDYFESTFPGSHSTVTLPSEAGKFSCFWIYCMISWQIMNRSMGGHFLTLYLSKLPYHFFLYSCQQYQNYPTINVSNKDFNSIESLQRKSSRSSWTTADGWR